MGPDTRINKELDHSSLGRMPPVEILENTKPATFELSI